MIERKRPRGCGCRAGVLCITLRFFPSVFGGIIVIPPWSFQRSGLFFTFVVKRDATNQLTLDVQNFLFEKRVFSWRQNTQGRIGRDGKLYLATKKGVPDILGCYQGHFFGVEIKQEKEALSIEQQGFVQSVYSAGGKVFVTRDIEVFKSEFRIWQRKPSPFCSW